MQLAAVAVDDRVALRARSRVPQVFARGFTNIIDIAFDRHGRLHVLEIATNGILAGAGQVLRIPAR